MKFKVSGVQHYKSDFKDILDVNDDFLLKKSEMLEDYDEGDVIYEYDIYDGPAELVPEPDNVHDRNAIAVMVEGIKIGYVPSDLCDEVRGMIDDEHICEVAIMGGPYKEVVSDSNNDLDIERGTLNFTASLTVGKKRAVQDLPPVHSDPVPKAAPESKPSGHRILNIIGCIFSIALIIMSLLILIISPAFGALGIIGGVIGFLYFKKKK